MKRSRDAALLMCMMVIPFTANAAPPPEAATNPLEIALNSAAIPS
ncbi:MAG TPA: hypothetical protein VLE46_05780 [Nitrospira sp.]|nr:hypothetical protein [Nitrospira sp.]